MNLAIIGCSGMGRIHAAMAHLCGVKIVACADKVRANAVQLAQAYGATAMTDGVKAIQRKDVQIVLIATPTPAHRPLIEAAAQAGKAIFSEKPLCRTVADCKAVLAAVKKHKARLFVGHVVRYFQEFEAMRAQIDAGRIGTPGFAKIYRGGIFPGGGKGWFADYTQSGGVTLDCMIHDLDWLRYAFGEPDHLYCQALLRSKPAPLDYSQVTMRMKSGLIATVIGTWAHPSGFQVKAEIVGDKGLIAFDSNDAPLHAQKRTVAAG
ncbi:MAG: Gfo/Idh/MocA family oxidoreductase, partial [Candidatus Hydrogenedentes bacterium]|nr:Gfo/Idh/MocA family oxidoreductase [Candidatus Hydrogenedentota bacterium]